MRIKSFNKTPIIRDVTATWVNNRPFKNEKGKWMYELMSDYSFEYDNGFETYYVIIPAGFIYDGASVPRWLWSLTGLTPDGKMRTASLTHDAIYVRKGRATKTSKRLQMYQNGERVEYTFTRKECDRLFRKQLIETGVSERSAKIAYWGVRIGGGFLWKINQ